MGLRSLILGLARTTGKNGVALNAYSRSLQSGTRCRVRFTLLVLLFLLWPARAQPQVKPVRRVLVIYEIGLSSPAVTLSDQGLQPTLRDSPYQIELYREYLETTLFPDSATQQEFRDWYIHKYRNRRLDLIVTFGPSALKFLVDAHEKFFPGIPIVFGGTSGDQAGNPTLDSSFTGVWQTWEPEKTLDLALRLRPAIRHLYVVGGTSAFDRQLEGIYKNHLQRYEGKLDISYLVDLDMETLLDRLKHLPEHSIVFQTHIGRDAKGTTYIGSAQADPMITAAANAPVFGPSDVDLGHGEVGGSLESFAEDGHAVGELAVKILNGARPHDIPITAPPNPYIFDWRALHRWGFNEALLPAGSQVLFRQRTPWETYRPYIIAVSVALLGQALVIFGLLWQRAKKKKLEQALVYSRDQLQLAMESAKSVGWEWDLQTGRNMLFGDLHTMYGISSDAFMGQAEDFYRYVHPEDMQTVKEAVQHARESRGPYAMEFRILWPDGKIRWVGARGKFEYRVNGEAKRMLGMAIDVTERRRAEEAVRESEQRFRLVANTAPVMIWMSGVDKLYTYFNQPWLNFTGRSTGEELGNGWFEGVHGEDRDRCLKTYVEAFDACESFEMEYRLRRHDGEYRWVVGFGVPRFNPDGSFAGYIGSCIDVTERKLAEEALSTVSRRLIEAHEEERVRIARELHDDVNQRLALIAVNLDVLKRELPQSATEACVRLSEVREQIKELGIDVQALSHRLHSSKLKYLGLTAAATAFCREFSERRGVQIDLHCDAIPRSVPEEISLCLFRVLQEALQNASKHSGSQHYEVSLECALHEIRLSVSDAGIGFDPEWAMRGRGLGITSMRERLKLVEGELSIEPRSPSGTVVRARVPLPAEARAAAAGKT